MFKLTITFFALAALLQCAVVLSNPLPIHQVASAKAAGAIDDAQAGGFTFMKRQIVSATVDAANDDDIADSDTPDLGLPPLEGIVPPLEGIVPLGTILPREDNYGGRGGYGGYGHHGLGYPQLTGPLEHTGLGNFGDNLGDAVDSLGEALGGIL